MNKSETIKELATALSKAQSQVQDARKDRNGQGYKYADLSQMLQIVRPVLADNGLAIVQFPAECEKDRLAIETVITHESGEFMSNSYSMEIEQIFSKAGKAVTSKAQASGSVITYMRRYALAAVMGITQEDSDAALQREAQQAAAEPKITPEQVAYLYPHVTEEGEGGALQWSIKGQMIFQEFGINVIEELPESRFNELKTRLEATG
jgi:hypothetical protein